MNDPFELLAMRTDDADSHDLDNDFRFATDFHTGALCFSECFDDPLLWAHYADKHKGVCLGFDVTDNPLEGERLLQVNYELERLADVYRPRMPDNVGGLADTRDLLIRTKHRRWEYEKEMRLVSVLEFPDEPTGIYFRKFDNRLQLKEVMLGVRFDLKNACGENLLKHLDLIGIKPARMSLDTASFAIVPAST